MFNQESVEDQDWLLAVLEPLGLAGFYESQDIANIMQGRQKYEIGIIAKKYGVDKSKLSTGEFLKEVRRQTPNIPSEYWWGVEQKCRLKMSEKK